MMTDPSKVGSPPGFDPATCRSLYVGNLHPSVTEGLLGEIFGALGQLESWKLIRDKVTGTSAGYGFVDFSTHQAAAHALQQVNGKNIYGHEIKVNWAFAGGQREDTSGHYHIFVGDLSPEIDDQALEKAFAAFGSCSDARVMWDQNTGRSRGYGFVAFRRKEDAERALTEMNGEWLGTRAIRCNWANQKVTTNDSSNLDYNNVFNQTPMTNTTVYVGNLTPDVSEALLKTVFSEFGYVEEVRVQGDKGFAFVRFQTHESAARAIVATHGRVLSTRAVKCSWGKERNSNIPPSSPPPTFSYPYPTYNMYNSQYGGAPIQYSQYPPSAPFAAGPQPVSYGSYPQQAPVPQGQIPPQYYSVDGQQKYPPYM